ncbi:MAG TPA: SH3 domain-containing protein [Candidatus Binatia bacterium]
MEGKYQSLADTRVSSGPGLHYPTIAKIKKGTKVDVVGEERGWLKVESRHGNKHKPGYVEASIVKPQTNNRSSILYFRVNSSITFCANELQISFLIQ